MEIRFYAADLAAYNNGILHGAWIDASDDPEMMQDAVNAMLRDSPCPNAVVACPLCEGARVTPFHNSETGATRQGPCPTCNGTGTVPSAEEWAIHDYDDQTGALRHLGETGDLDKIAAIAGAIEAISDDHGDELTALLVDWASDRESDPDEWADLVSDAFAGTWSDPEDFAAESFDGVEIPAALQNYINWRAMARDMALNGDVDFICTATGRHLQDYDDMRGRECVVLWNH